MKVKLETIANTRSGDKGANSNVGIVFRNKNIYDWAEKNLTADVIKDYFSSVVLGRVERYELKNLFALNFILYDSLGGGGSESLLNDAQGKTHGQALAMLEIEIPDKLLENNNG